MRTRSALVDFAAVEGEVAAAEHAQVVEQQAARATFVELRARLLEQRVDLERQIELLDVERRRRCERACATPAGRAVLGLLLRALAGTGPASGSVGSGFLRVRIIVVISAAAIRPPAGQPAQHLERLLVHVVHARRVDLDTRIQRATVQCIDVKQRVVGKCTNLARWKLSCPDTSCSSDIETTSSM